MNDPFLFLTNWINRACNLLINERSLVEYGVLTFSLAKTHIGKFLGDKCEQFIFWVIEKPKESNAIYSMIIFLINPKQYTGW